MYMGILSTWGGCHFPIIVHPLDPVAEIADRSPKVFPCLVNTTTLPSFSISDVAMWLNSKMIYGKKWCVPGLAHKTNSSMQSLILLSFSYYILMMPSMAWAEKWHTKDGKASINLDPWKTAWSNAPAITITSQQYPHWMLHDREIKFHDIKPPDILGFVIAAVTTLIQISFSIRAISSFPFLHIFVFFPGAFLYIAKLLYIINYGISGEQLLTQVSSKEEMFPHRCLKLLWVPFFL